MSTELDHKEQVQKLELATRLVDEATKSTDVDRHLGALLLCAGIVDFMAIQAARLVEQIVLKGQLANNKNPTFQPHEDTYFYDNRVSTRVIFKEMRKLLPFSVADPASANKAAQVTELCRQMIEAGLKFLNYRNPVVHHIGNPKKSFDDLIALCEKSLSASPKFNDAHRAFMEAAAPFRFSEKELIHFYGEENQQSQ